MSTLTIDQPRSYDYGAGDRRFYDFGKAVVHAEAEAQRTGVRQSVRVDEGTLEEVIFLVQAIR